MSVKLLYVCTVASTFEAFLTPFAETFRKKGWQVDAMGRGAKDSSECEECFDDVIEVEWTRNPFNMRAIFNSVVKVRAEVIARKYDIVHVHTPIAAFIVRFALRGREKGTRPIVLYTAHGFHFHKNGNRLTNMLFIILEKIAGKWTDGLITINKDDFRSAQEWKFVEAGRLFYVPGIGVDLNKYKRYPERERLLSELGIPVNAKILISISEFTKNKRHQDQLFALNTIEHNNVHLLCVGVGSQLEKIRSLASDLKIESRVHFLGLRSDIPYLLSSADVLVHTSDREGLPRCVLEAFSVGIPVVGARARGTQDLLSGRCGVLVNIGDYESMAAALTKLLGDKHAQKQIVTNAAAKVNQFKIEAVLSMHEKIYEFALGSDSSKLSGVEHS